MSVTLKDIARDAKVSMSTASYVLSGTSLHKFSEDTCKRVLKSAERLHYRPNIKARGLSKGRTYMVGALINQLAISFVPEIIQGLEKVLEDNGYCLILTTFQPDEFTDKCNYLYQHGVEGVAVLRMESMSTEDTGDLKLHDIPIVSIAANVANYPKVLVQPQETGEVALHHLAELGHRAIAYSGTIPTRLQGILTAADAYEGIHVFYRDCGAPILKNGDEIMEWLKMLDSLPTAVITDSDIEGISLIQTAVMAGLKVPDDLSVVGTDGLEIGKYSIPPLTSVGQPTAEQGSKAAELLIAAIEGQKIEDYIFHPFLLERKSCKKIHS